VTLHIRNFLSRPQRHRIEVQAPHGVTVEPVVLEGSEEPGSSSRSRLKVSTAAGQKPGVYVVALDVTLDGKRYGEWFDMIVCATP
jgi:hypothetical protein